jgi:hypothetical protein
MLPNYFAPKLASWLQDNKFALMPNPARHTPRLKARARENIPALGAPDGGARVLRHEKPLEWTSVKQEFGRRNPDRYARRVTKRIGGQAPA